MGRGFPPTRTEPWPGPNAWRTTGTAWAYEYQLRETGILKAPQLTLLEKPVKNKEGVDSPKTAKELYEKYWNKQNKK